MPFFTQMSDSWSSGNESKMDCGIWNDEVEYKVTTCSFWMEGVLLTGTGKINCSEKGHIYKIGYS